MVSLNCFSFNIRNCYCNGSTSTKRLCLLVFGAGVLIAGIVCLAVFLPEDPPNDSTTPRPPTTPTTTSIPNSPSNVHIIILPGDLQKSYIFSGDGEVLVKPSIDSKSSIDGSSYALLRGEMYIFGGSENVQRIGLLSGCSFIDLSVKLKGYYLHGSAAIDIDDGMRALIAFDFSSSWKCEIFDTQRTELTHSPKYNHDFGRLGLYQGQPTTVGNTFYQENGEDMKVESYLSSGWTTLPSHPKRITDHTLTGLSTGELLMAGGYDKNRQEFLRDIWQLKKGLWELIGFLQEYNESGSSIRIGQYVYLVPGTKGDSNGLYPLERIKVQEETIETEVIGSYLFGTITPAVFEATADFCV